MMPWLLEKQLSQSIPVWSQTPPFSFVCASIISILFIISALLLCVHPLYLIVHIYLTQLRCLTYYY